MGGGGAGGEWGVAPQTALGGSDRGGWAIGGRSQGLGSCLSDGPSEQRGDRSKY